MENCLILALILGRLYFFFGMPSDAFEFITSILRGVLIDFQHFDFVLIQTIFFYSLAYTKIVQRKKKLC